MSNKYLEKIAAHLSKRELNREAWRGTGYASLGGVLGLPASLPGSLAGSGVGTHMHLKDLAKRHNLKNPTVGRSGKGLAWGERLLSTRCHRRRGWRRVVRGDYW